MHLGGAEYNVAVNMANFGYGSKLASILPDNLLGNLALENLAKYNVNTDFVESSGERLGTYYVESGIGPKAPNVIYDRKHSSFVTNHLTCDLDSLFSGVSLLHVTGITIALSDDWLTTIIKIMHFAMERGVKISFDMNYCSKLWTVDQAKKAYQQVLPYIDYCSANKKDAVAFFEVDEHEKNYYHAMKRAYPNIELFFSTYRTVVNATHQTLAGNLWINNQLYTSDQFDIYPIVDRIGSGDACSANKKDAVAFFEVDEHEKNYYHAMKRAYPNIELFFSTYRTVVNATHQTLAGNLWINNQLYTSDQFDIYPIVDRIGSGDAFTAGILHGILSQTPPAQMIDFATVSSVLKHSIKGDVNLFSHEDIKAFIDDGSSITR